MYACETTVVNQLGLHARPAGQFVLTATKFCSDIRVINLNNEKEANAKSIVSLLMLAAKKGTPIQIKAIGEDEELAVNSLVTLIEGGFGDM